MGVVIKLLLFGNCSEGLDSRRLIGGLDGGLPSRYADRNQNADNRDRDRGEYYYRDEKISFHYLYLLAGLKSLGAE